jgi:2'-5' RNA ligase
MSFAPLIVTLSLDESSFSFFNTLRSKHFPPQRNYLKAHLTLFHHLPSEPSILTTLKHTAAQHNILPLEVTRTVLIGNGVAYKLESGELLKLHATLQEVWKAWLTPQDQQRLWPHVTVQNKVQPAKAQALYEQLTQQFSPFTAYGTGLSVWVYRDGPWEPLATYPFLN